MFKQKSQIPLPPPPLSPADEISKSLFTLVFFCTYSWIAHQRARNQISREGLTVWRRIK
jgi:hypothetical protein